MDTVRRPQQPQGSRWLPHAFCVTPVCVVQLCGPRAVLFNLNRGTDTSSPNSSSREKAEGENVSSVPDGQSRAVFICPHLPVGSYLLCCPKGPLLPTHPCRPGLPQRLTLTIHKLSPCFSRAQIPSRQP